MQNLDSIDLQILKHLQENSNINTKELASKLFLTVTPVYERIKRLERDGYIMKYVALLDKKIIANDPFQFQSLIYDILFICFIKLIGYH